MDSTLAQLLQALSGNAAPNIMGNPGGIAGSRLAYMQGQNANANQLLNQQVFTGQQGINAMGGAQQAREAMAAPGGALNPAQGGAPPAQASPPVQAAPVPQPPPMGQPAPNPPGVMQQQLPQNVPMPGASPIPQVSMSQLQANMGKGGAIPPPPSQPQLQQMGQQTDQSTSQTGDQQNGQDQLPPQQAQDLQQTLQQNLQGMHAPQYKDIINAVKQAMPNATPMQRALATADIMKDVNSQTNEVLKQYQQAILTQRLGQSQERMGINEQRLDLAKDKAGLGGGGATDKILDFSAKNAQAKAAGNVGGRTNVARADAEKVLNGPALKAAMAYLPPDQNALEGWIQKQGANFENSPQFKAFKAGNTAAAGEIARALAGGGLPKAGLTTEIEGELNNATDQKAYMAVVQSYLATTGAAAGATEDVVKQGGNTAPADDSEGIQINAPAPPQVGMVKDGYRFKGGDPAKEENWQAVGGQ